MERHRLVAGPRCLIGSCQSANGAQTSESYLVTYRNSQWAYRDLDVVLMAHTVILMYHSIADNPKDPHSVHPDVFAAQMERLAASGIRVVEFESALLEMSAWDARTRVVISFDDAYSDFLVNALPVLLHHRFPAIVFAPTGLLGRTASWDTYDRTKTLMGWDELVEVRRLGFGIAGHTVSHARLTECSDSELERELCDSLCALREHLDHVVPVLSYPSGHFGSRECAAARRAGYEAAVGVSSRFANYPWTNPYALRRRKWLS